MNIDYIFKQYGYDKVPFETLPKETQGYITAAQYIEADLIPSMVSIKQAKQNKTVLETLKTEIAVEVLEELSSHIRTAVKEMIIAVVDSKNGVEPNVPN